MAWSGDQSGVCPGQRRGNGVSEASPADASIAG
jgi:hypothetical protein